LALLTEQGPTSQASHQHRDVNNIVMISITIHHKLVCFSANRIITHLQWKGNWHYPRVSMLC